MGRFESQFSIAGKSTISSLILCCLKILALDSFGVFGNKKIIFLLNPCAFPKSKYRFNPISLFRIPESKNKPILSLN